MSECRSTPGPGCVDFPTLPAPQPHPSVRENKNNGTVTTDVLVAESSSDVGADPSSVEIFDFLSLGC